jgi:hypothetical protein
MALSIMDKKTPAAAANAQCETLNPDYFYDRFFRDEAEEMEAEKKKAREELPKETDNKPNHPCPPGGNAVARAPPMPFLRLHERRQMEPQELVPLQQLQMQQALQCENRNHF